MVLVGGALAALGALAVAWFAGVRRILNRDKTVAQATITSPEEHTNRDEHGAVRSIQAADLRLPTAALDAIWSPMHLERLARTYWRYLTRATLGLVRVLYEEDGRRIVLLIRPLTLLRFKVPEYAMDDTRGIVRWRIADGVLVAGAGRDRDGYLEIDVERCDPPDEPTSRLHVEVEVANFYPMLSGIAYWFYANTQSRIHVLLTHGFLRSLARLDLAESRAGRFARGPAEVPDPPLSDEPPSRTRLAEHGAEAGTTRSALR